MSRLDIQREVPRIRRKVFKRHEPVGIGFQGLFLFRHFERKDQRPAGNRNGVVHAAYCRQGHGEQEIDAIAVGPGAAQCHKTSGGGCGRLFTQPGPAGPAK